MEELTLLAGVSPILNRLRRRMRSGIYSRRPLEILRFDISQTKSLVSCDWLIRSVDEWDYSLPRGVRSRVHCQQALQDALTMRAFIFRYSPESRSANLHAFRMNENGAHELVIAGTMHRSDDMPRSLPSLAMRAHLFGFHFIQDEGALTALPYDGLRSGRVS